MNQFFIRVPCINIENSEVLFEQYRMDINWDKYGIEVRNYDTMNRNRIFFGFMQQTFNCLDGLYLRERYLLMDVIINIDLHVPYTYTQYQ